MGSLCMFPVNSQLFLCSARSKNQSASDLTEQVCFFHLFRQHMITQRGLYGRKEADIGKKL